MSANKHERSFQGERGLQNLRSNLLDLLFAGSDTTSTSLNWAMLLMTKYPNIQTEVQEELDNVCGRERLPSSSDRPSRRAQVVPGFEHLQPQVSRQRWSEKQS